MLTDEVLIAIEHRMNRRVSDGFSTVSTDVDHLTELLRVYRAVQSGEWRPVAEAPQTPGAHINVRSVTSYRWLPYKPDGARQMKKAGRWQVFDGYGWTNADLPENAEWQAVSTQGPQP